MISPELLRRYPAFAHIDAEDLKQISNFSEEREFEEGRVVFREREPAGHLFVITRGEVDIFATLGSGDRAVVDTLGAGDLLLLSAVIPPYQTRFGAVTRVPSRTIAIEAEALRGFIAGNTAVGYVLLQGVVKAMSERLDGTRNQLAAGP